MKSIKYLFICGILLCLISLNLISCQASLIAECGDRNYLNNTADYIIEGTVENVEIHKSSTYIDLKMTDYVKGIPFTDDTVQIRIPGGSGLWVEGQPIFYEDKEVRIYFRYDSELLILCGVMGVEEIFENLSYQVDDGCNLEGEEGIPVSELIDISQIGSSIKIEQILQIPNSNPQNNLNINYSISGNNIEIREIFDTGEIELEDSIPVCSVSIWGQLDNLEKENYNITFVFEDKSSNQTRIITEKEFELKEDYFYLSWISSFLEFLKDFQSIF